MKAILLFTALLLAGASFAQKKPTFSTPVPVSEEEDDDGLYIIEDPSTHGSFTVTGKEAGKTKTWKVNYLCYGNDTTWMTVCDEANLIFRSEKPLALTVKVARHRHPETVYDIPVTVTGNHYHLDLTPLSETIEGQQRTYTFAIYDDQQNLVHQINWNLYCVKGTHD